MSSISEDINNGKKNDEFLNQKNSRGATRNMFDSELKKISRKLQNSNKIETSIDVIQGAEFTYKEDELKEEESMPFMD